MQVRFCITLHDTALSEQELRRWWQEGLEPAAFVEWLGESMP